ncbi:MAG TPA: cysteine-rich CWC family protein [Burkholderiales bacterium]|nr:cysteine-rich CWC family protein [Burkholderiales bacterium]
MPPSPASDRASPDARCSACGAPFHCGAKEDDCWCASLPPLKNLQDGTCLCKACLEKKLARERT